ncbi:MAG: ATP-dependent helicase [Treponema sp.]|nr:ATP-dependent helicase [Treponema sp.]
MEPAAFSPLDRYLSLLNEEQLAAVKHEGSPLLILAGAGSGKTRVITTKIAYLIAEKNVAPYSILAVTFTKKAAKEMAERAVLMDSRAAQSVIRTFHSFGAWFLRRFAEDAGVDPNFTVYDDDDMATLVGKAVPSLSRQEASHAAHKISLAKDYCLAPDSPDLITIESNPDFPQIYAEYEKRLRVTGNVDFGDLIMLPVLVLQRNEEIRRQMHYRFKVIMVDEYQDSNVAQFKLLQALSGVEENTGTYVCVVGDDDQSIYKFRGAEVQNILTFQNHFPGTQLIRLEQNYRSTARILAAADSVVRNNEDRLGKTLRAVRGKGGEPVLVFLPTQDDETAFCADLIEKAHAKGCPYKDWAILYRTNAQSLGFETEFLHRKIPYTVVGSLKFYDREEIKDMLAFAALTANPRDEIAFRRIVNKPTKGIGGKSQDMVVLYSQTTPTLDGAPVGLVQACRECAKQLSKKAATGVMEFAAIMDELTACVAAEKSGDTLSSFIEKIANRTGLLEYHSAQDEVSGTQRAGNIQELINSAVLYPCTRQGLLDFLDSIELDRTIENPDQEDTDSVTLITLHNTKGLEFPRVVITGLEEGIFPRQDKSSEELEEERRLFYVGITRAQDELYITACTVRRLYGRTEYMQPSRFLAEAGKGIFKVLGNVPSAYGYAVGDSGSSLGAGGFGTGSIGAQTDPLAKKYKKGTRIYHDDYGYGYVVATGSRSGEFVITVQFENGSAKQFLPKYQGHSLMIEDEM